MNRRAILAAVMSVGLLTIGGIGAYELTDSAGGSTPCTGNNLSGTVMHSQCSSTDASWVVGTNQPATTTVAPTTTTSIAVTTTVVQATTTISAATTTTVPTSPVVCTDFDSDPTNTFHVNGGSSGSTLINSARPIISLSADGPLSEYTVKINSTVLSTVYKSNPASVVCIQSEVDLPEGINVISAVENKPNPQAITPYNFTVDTIPPPPPVITNASYSSNYVRVAGTGIPGSHISVREQGKAGTGGSTVGSTGTWTCAYSRPSGTHVIYAVQQDAAVNTSDPSNSVIVTVP